MSRLLTRAVRLLKLGAVVGTAVGVGRLIMRRRRKPDAGEATWPTIAETAAQNGQPLDGQPDDGADRDEGAGEADSSADAGAADEDEDDHKS